MEMNQLPRLPDELSADDADVAMLDAELTPSDDIGTEVEELEDGSAVIKMPEGDPGIESDAFDENLAEMLPESFLSSLGIEQDDLVKADREARKERDGQYAEGIKRTGMGKEAPGGADFEGASKAVHPMMAKGCVDFASRAIKELMPANGPCKTQIIGEATEHKIDKAERKKTYMNWQYMTQVQENRAEFERMLSQLPLGGSQYKRWWYDPALKRNRTAAVYIDDVILPYNQSDFYTSHRVTQVEHLSKAEYQNRIASGLYRDLDLTPPGLGYQEQSKAKAATDKVEGAEEDYTAYNEEGHRDIYLMYVDLDVEDDPLNPGRAAPYILHIDCNSTRVLGLYRNWKEDDDRYAKKHWMVEYNFIPWRGAYGIGLGHLIGSLSAAATGSLRALLDSAHISNFPGGLKLKGGRTAGQSMQINATELAEIDAPPGVDDIRKLVMPFPFPGPSNVLMQLLEWLSQQAESVVTTASEKIAEGGANMPMGTALALIEHGSVNFSAIHARLHASLKKELEIVHRLNAEYLTDEEVVEELGELVVSREDFEGPMDIIPVSDPNIFSEAQRYAQLQAVLQLKSDPQFAPFFKADQLLQRSLRLLQFPNPDDIATLPKDPKRLGPLDENYAITLEDPAPLKAYADQDDVAHLEAHVHFMTSPMFGANPLIAPAVLAPMLQHCKEHLMAFYKKHVKAAKETMMAMAQAHGFTMTEVEAEAKAAAFADQLMAEALGPIVMPGLAGAQKMAAEMAPKPPPDPSIVAQQAGETERKKLQLESDEKMEGQKATIEQGATATAAQMEQLQQDTDKRLAQYATTMEAMRDDFKAAADMQKQELANQQERYMAVLTKSLEQFGAPGGQVLTIEQVNEAIAGQNQQTGQLLDTLMQKQSQSEQSMSEIRQLLTNMIPALTPTGAPQ